MSLSAVAPAFLYKTKSGADAAVVSVPTNNIFSAVELDVDCITGAVELEKIACVPVILPNVTLLSVATA